MKRGWAAFLSAAAPWIFIVGGGYFSAFTDFMRSRTYDNAYGLFWLLLIYLLMGIVIAVICNNNTKYGKDKLMDWGQFIGLLSIILLIIDYFSRRFTGNGFMNFSISLFGATIDLGMMLDSQITVLFLFFGVYLANMIRISIRRV